MREGECCQPIGCGCPCHNPIFGLEVKHFAPCCDKSGMMITEEDSDARS